MLPRIATESDELGFRWCWPDGRPARLVELVGHAEAEPDRWLPTHLEATDDLLITVAGRFGEVLGGGRRPAADEYAALTRAYVAIDRASAEYIEAARAARLRTDLRGGQILGTAALLSIRSREALGVIGPAPFTGELDPPPVGVVGGLAGLYAVSETEPWRGSRWLVVTDDGRRLPATLSMLTQDSSGVDREATLTEHRAALKAVTDAVTGAEDPMVASGAVDWLLFDWLMAHRDGPDSGAIEIAAGRLSDARMILDAVGASIVVRRAFDPSLGLIASELGPP